MFGLGWWRWAKRRWATGHRSKRRWNWPLELKALSSEEFGFFSKHFLDSILSRFATLTTLTSSPPLLLDHHYHSHCVYFDHSDQQKQLSETTICKKKRDPEQQLWRRPERQFANYALNFSVAIIWIEICLYWEYMSRICSVYLVKGNTVIEACWCCFCFCIEEVTLFDENNKYAICVLFNINFPWGHWVLMWTSDHWANKALFWAVKSPWNHSMYKRKKTKENLT